jgi:uncharacterized protein
VSPGGAAAAAAMTELARSPAPWALPWPCLGSPSAVPLSEGDAYWPGLQALLGPAKVAGPLVHDARVAALCLSRGIRELWTADRDFSRFPRLKTANPLV